MKKLIILIISITFIGILPSILQYGCFMVAKDFSTQQVPFIIETKRMLSTGTPYWSWNTYIGSDFIGSYSFYTLTSPFVWFACLFPYKQIFLGITLALFLKMIAAGIFTYIYLLKIHISKDNALIGGLLYTFSSFSISNIGYYHFMEPMIVFPLFLYTIEIFLHREKHAEVLLSLGAFIVAFTNYYFLPGSLICGLIYVLCRITADDVKISTKRFYFAILLIIIGVLISSFIIVPTILLMSGNPRVETNSDLWLPNILERISTLFLPKILERHTPMLLGSGWNSNAVSLPVVGILFAYLYVAKRKNWVRWLVLSALILYVTPLNGIFTLFTNPTYSRWAYGFSLFLVIATSKYLDSNTLLSAKQLILYILIAIGYTSMYYLYSNLGRITNYKHDLNIVDYFDNGIIIIIIFISIFFLYIYYKKQTSKTLLLCISIFSCMYMSTRIWMITDSYQEITLAESGQIINKSGYIKKYIINNKLPESKESFKYRTDFVTRDLNIYQNLALLTNRPSVESYNSACYHCNRKLLSTADTVNRSGYFFPNKNVEAFDALLSVKDIIVYNDIESRMNRDLSHYSIIEKNNDYTIYNNPYYIPMGFVYDKYILESAIDSLKRSPNYNIPIQLLANLVIKDEDQNEIDSFLSRGALYTGNNLDSLVNTRKIITTSSFVGSSKGISAKINLPEDNLVFFSIPANNNFTAYIDGVTTKIYEVNLGLSAICVRKGYHSIEFKYFPFGLQIGIIISILSLILLLIISCIIKERNGKDLCNYTCF